MSLIKLALDKEAAGIWQAIKSVGKAVKGTVKGAGGRVKQKVKGAKSGFKHGDIADFAEEQLEKNKSKGKRIQDLRKKLEQHKAEASKAGLAGQKAEAEYHHKKLKKFKFGAGAVAGLTGLTGFAIGKKKRKEVAQ